MINIVEIFCIQILGILLCVLRYPGTGKYTAYYDLLFQNTGRFDTYNLPSFSVIHLIWFIVFELVMMRNIIRKINDSKGMFEMELYRSSFGSALKNMIRDCAFNTSVLLTGQFITILAVCFVRGDRIDSIGMIIGSGIFMLKQFVWFLALGSVYFQISLLADPQTGTYAGGLMIIFVLLLDIMAGTSFVVYNDQLLINAAYLVILLLVFAFVLTIFAAAFKKGEEV